MILFYGEGRLGNQVFQYQALNHIAKANEVILSIGLEELQPVFELKGPKLNIIIKNQLLKRVAKYFLIPLLLRPIASTLRLITYVREPIGGAEPHIGATGEIRTQPGLIKCITFVDGGYYQNSTLWQEAFPTKLFTLSASLRADAQQYLASAGAATSIPFFVHVRRGDYLTYSSYGLDNFVLPADFYRRAIGIVSKKIEHVHFVFVTDDEAWVTDNFHDIQNKSIASFSPKLDFAIMTVCHGGILSNSTFSLAAAFMLNCPAIIIAPQYWFGFRVSQWYPPRIKTMRCVSYIPVIKPST